MSMQVVQPMLLTKREICLIDRSSLLAGRFSGIFRITRFSTAYLKSGVMGRLKPPPQKNEAAKGGAASFESVELRDYSSRSSAAKARAFRSCFRSTPGYSLRMFSTR